MEQHVQLIRTQKPPMNPIPKNRLLFSAESELRSLCSSRISVKASDAELKHNWMASLSCPFPHITDSEKDSNSSLVFGIDPDVSGALALLNGDLSAQVYDSPHLKVLVGKTVRRRLDAKSIVQLLRSFDAPLGSRAFLEQSTPYPQDGKLGWWSGGFGYGLWIGILVGLGFSVVPVPSHLWKKNFELTGSMSTKVTNHTLVSAFKNRNEIHGARTSLFIYDAADILVKGLDDDSRRVASALFPSLSSEFRRKKDHGRAEALLIAAYGKGLKLKSESCNPEDLNYYAEEFHRAAQLFKTY